MAEPLAARTVDDVAEKGASSLLDTADEAAIREYTGPAYKEINAYHRGVELDPERAAHLEGRNQAISRALSKRPAPGDRLLVERLRAERDRAFAENPDAVGGLPDERQEDMIGTPPPAEP